MASSCHRSSAGVDEWEIGALARAPWRPATPLPLDSAHYDCGRLARRLPYRVHGSVCVAEKKPAASLCYFQSRQPAKKKTVGIRSLRLVSLVVQRFSTSGIMFPCCRPRMGLHSDQRLKDGDSRGGRFFISRCITTESRHRSLPDASRDGRSCDLRIPAQANAPAGSREPCPVRQDGTELDWVSRHRQRVAVSRISMGFPFGARGCIPPDKVKVSEAPVHCQGKSADRAVLLSIKRSTPILGGSPR